MSQNVSLEDIVNLSEPTSYKWLDRNSFGNNDLIRM
jgi:hypothetical protein